MSPVGPVVPVSPWGPVDPVAPVSPSGPVSPVEPVGPTAPVAPILNNNGCQTLIFANKEKSYE